MGNTENQAKVVPQTLSEWLTLLFETYGRKPSELQILSYAVALDDLNELELRLAIPGAVKRNATGFPPSPGQVREALELERESLPQSGTSRSQEHDECPNCGGMGWKVIAREVVVAEPHNGTPKSCPYNFAVRCDHRAADVAKNETRADG